MPWKGICTRLAIGEGGVGELKHGYLRSPQPAERGMQVVVRNARIKAAGYDDGNVVGHVVGAAPVQEIAVGIAATVEGSPSPVREYGTGGNRRSLLSSCGRVVGRESVRPLRAVPPSARAADARPASPRR